MKSFDTVIIGAGFAGLYMLYRLRQQMEAIAAGEEPSNIIRPAGLRRMEREQLRRALRTVKAFQQRLARRYHLEI